MKPFLLLIASSILSAQGILPGIFYKDTAPASGLATPTFSPGTGTYTAHQSVTISYPGGSTVCYRTDGVTPTAATPGTCDAPATTYSGAIAVTASGVTVITAIATEVGYANSSVGTATLTLNLTMITKLMIPGIASGNTCSYNVMAGGNTCYGAESIMPTAGYFRKLYVKLASDPDSGGSSKGYSYTLYQNDATTAVTVSVLSSTSGFQAAYTGSDLHFVKGDLIKLRIAGISSPANSPEFSAIIEFQSGTANEAILLGGALALDTTDATFLPVSGAVAANVATENHAFTMFPMAATITGMEIRVSGAVMGTGNSRTFTIRQTHAGSTSPVGTPIVYGAAANGVISSAESITVAAGDLIDIESNVTSTPPTGVTFYVGLTYAPTVNGQFLIPLSNSTTQLSTSGTNYAGISSMLGPSATETNVQNVVTSDFTLQGWTAWLDASPGSGTYTPSLRRNGADAGTNYATAMSTQGPTISASTSYSIVANYDVLDTLITPASSPTAGRITMSYIGYIAP